MAVTASQVRQLRTGAKHAHSVDIHRLARLLEGLADLAQMILDGVSTVESEIMVPDVIDRGATVARDLCRSAEIIDFDGEAELVT